MGEKVINQHFVPQMYLRRFTPDQRRFCVWNLTTNDILSRQRPGNYAAKRYFYNASEKELSEALKELFQLYPEIVDDIDISDEQFVEKALSRAEGDASKTIDLICDNHENLYNETNMRKMIIFVHDLAYRTEKYRNSLDNVRNQTLSHFSRLGISADQVAGMDKTSKDNQLYQILGVGPVLNTAKMLIENYNWYIGTVTGSMKLIISDNPAQGFLLGFNDICFPLCGDTAIIFRINNPDSPIISQDMPNGNEIKLSERSVFSYNAIQLSYAERFMFGDKLSLSLLKMMVDKQGGYSKMFGNKPILHSLF